MTFQALNQTNQKLSQNPELSKHNKEVLNNYFRYKKTSVGGSHLQDMASRFNSLAELIDFPLDEPEKKDVEKLIGAINHDELKKANGENYSEYSKDSLYKTLTNFYTDFLDYKEWFEDFSNPANIQVKVEPEKIPSPEHIRKFSAQANNLRDKAFIMFGWATGARIGELLYTQESHKYPEGIKWRDIRFDENEMWVTLRGKTGEREIPVRTSKPLMKRLWEQSDKDLDGHVFKERNQSNLCPKCGKKAKTRDRSTYSRRTYGCDNCGWKGKHTEARKEKKPWKDSAARKTLKRIIGETDASKNLHKNPHKVFRTARALYWASKDKNEDFLRAFMGWSKNSDAPKHYISLMQESLLSGLRQEFGEELSDDERKFDDDSLKPANCFECGEWVSPLWSYCKNCETELDEEIRLHNQPSSEEIEEAHAMKNTMLDLADEMDLPKDEFRDLANDRMEEMKKKT